MKNYQDVAQKFVKALRSSKSTKGLDTKEMYEIMASVLPKEDANNFDLNPSHKKTPKEGATCSDLTFFVALQSPEYIKQRRALHLSFRQAQFRMAQYLDRVAQSSKKSAVLITDNWHLKLANWKLDEKIDQLSKKFNIEIYLVDLDDELILVDEKFETDLILGFIEMPIEKLKEIWARAQRVRSLSDRSEQFLERVYEK